MRAYPEKCFIWCTEDNPLSYLPGLFVSMPKHFFDPRLHRAFRYFSLHTERWPVPEARERDLLYSFLGAPTAPVRQIILGMNHPPDALVRERLNYNHQRWAPDDAVGPYAEVLARSQFTLCPPGSGTSSYRLFEAMRAGSAPVIISDDLVLPEGPDWRKCSVRLAEADVTRIEAVLRAIAHSGGGMGQAAQREFDQYFSAEKILHHVARELTALGPANLRLAKRNYRLSQAWMAAGKISGKVRQILRGRPGARS